MKTRLSLAVIVSLSTSLMAAPDGGNIMQNIEKDQAAKSTQQRPALGSVSSTKEEASSPKVKISSFVFNGNNSIPSFELEQVVKPYIGKSLSFLDLQAVTAKVSDYYAAKGYLAKVYLPKQEISNGNIIISIIEGKLNSIIIDRTQAVMSEEKGQKYIDAFNTRGAAITNRSISKSISNLNNVGGVKASSSLAPGAVEGSSDLVVKIKDTSRYQADVGVDNYGSKYTGKNELTAGLIVNNLSKSDRYDNLNLRMLTSEGVRFARAAYSMPLGYNGDKIGMTASAMTYRLVEGETQGDGYSNTIGLTYTHPFIRTKEFNVNFSSDLQWKKYHNIANDAPTSDKKVVVASGTLSMDSADTFNGGGMNAVGVTLTAGKLDLKGLESNLESDKDGLRTNGNYAKLSVNAMRLQSLSEALTLQGRVNAQWANKNLDSSEEFALGGISGVRAYPTGEGYGDQGWMSSLELRYAATPELTPSIFVDYGRLIVNKNPLTSSTSVEGYTLGGTGVGVSYTNGKSLTLNAQAARALGTNANTVNGKNSDGSTTSDYRYWLSASWFF